MEDALLDRFARRPPPLDERTALDVTVVEPRRLLLNVRQGDARVALLAAGLTRPYPSALRRLLAGDPDVQAVVVEHVPVGFDEAARTAGIAYLDLHGRGRIEQGRVRYQRAGGEVDERVSRRTSDPFARKASRIPRALLSAPDRRWRVSQLASQVGIDVGNAHRVLTSLVEAGYVERDRDDYVVADPGGLLDAWAEATRRPREYLALPVVLDLEEDVRRLVHQVLDGEAVVSGELGAELLAPYLSAGRAVVHAVTPRAWAEVEEWKDTRSSLGGERDQIFVDFQDPGVAQFAVVRHGVPVATPAQVYVDLRADLGRGREAAEHLRRELLQF